MIRFLLLASMIVASFACGTATAAEREPQPQQDGFEDGDDAPIQLDEMEMSPEIISEDSANDGDIPEPSDE